ncbi:MAG: type II toxin-antitoxin system HicB family antitoxin [bacterium]
MQYTIILKQEDDGRFCAHSVDFPTCHSWGETRDEALKNIKEAIDGYKVVVRELLQNKQDHAELVTLTV